MWSKSTLSTAAILCALILTRGAWAKTIYVDDNAPAGGNGISWATAYRFLQNALAEAAEGPVQIRVGQGTYRPDCSWANPAGTGDRLATFALFDGLTLTGGFAGLGAVEPNAWDADVYVTTLSGDLAGNDVLSEDPLDFVEDPNDGRWSRPDQWCLLIESTRQENSLHVLTAVGTGAAVVEGCVITGGHAFNPPYWWSNHGIPCTEEHSTGGALFNEEMAVTLRSCLIWANCSICSGGAVDSLDSAGLVFEDCRLMENYSGNFGGALRAEKAVRVAITRCVIQGNRAHHGGAAMWAVDGSLTLTDCTFSFNGSEDWGHAVYVGTDRTAIDRCTFEENEGGGLHSVSGSTDISDSVFRRNATNCGGAIRLSNDSMSVNRCVFAGNTASQGGAINNEGYSDVFMANCLLEGNVASYGGGGAYTAAGHMTFVNCVLWGNRTEGRGGGLLAHYASTLAIDNCIMWANEASEGTGIALTQYSNGSLPSSARIAHSLMENSTSSVSLDSACTVFWGSGNVEDDPCFVDPGYWDDNGTTNDPNDDFFVEGDYHLKSQAGRWDPASGSWVQDDVTSSCIDAGDPNSPIMFEPFPNGGIINMGAYGGTAEASKSYFGGPVCETIITGDINGDCRVNLMDLAILLNHWLEIGIFAETESSTQGQDHRR